MSESWESRGLWFSPVEASLAVSGAQALALPVSAGRGWFGDLVSLLSDRGRRVLAGPVWVTAEQRQGARPAGRFVRRRQDGRERRVGCGARGAAGHALGLGLDGSEQVVVVGDVD